MLSRSQAEISRNHVQTQVQTLFLGSVLVSCYLLRRGRRRRNGRALLRVPFYMDDRLERLREREREGEEREREPATEKEGLTYALLAAI